MGEVRLRGVESELRTLRNEFKDVQEQTMECNAIGQALGYSTEEPPCVKPSSPAMESRAAPAGPEPVPTGDAEVSVPESQGRSPRPHGSAQSCAVKAQPSSA